MKRFKVRYARIVVMETVVELQESEVGQDGKPKVCLDNGLPGVYDGLEINKLLGVIKGPHIKEISDYDGIYNEEELKEHEG